MSALIESLKLLVTQFSEFFIQVNKMFDISNITLNVHDYVQWKSSNPGYRNNLSQFLHQAFSHKYL